MIISNNTLPTALGSNEEQFQIANSRKLYNILSDKLYKHKIAAIIRELSTNAVDAHVASNNIVPFDVYLPTPKSLKFVIRDYGTGLSPKAIKEVYTTYGASDKEDSNSYIGCLGLGSKTPFCYNTRTATIVSYYENNRYEYFGKIQSDGIPTLQLISTQPTQEHNGVEITVPVLQSDMQNFVDTAKEVFKYFRIKPKIHDCNITFPPITYCYKNKHGGFRQDVSYSNGGVQAIMGNIAYPISLPIDESLDYLREYLDNANVDLFCEIGQLDTEASREGLSYDTRTIENIVNKVKDFVAIHKAETQKKIDDTACLFNARQLLYKILKKEYVEYHVTYNGQILDRTNYLILPNGTQTFFHARTHRNRTTHIYIDDVETEFFIKDNKDYSRRLKSEAALNKKRLILLPDTNQTTLDSIGINRSDVKFTSFLPKVASTPRTSQNKKQLAQFYYRRYYQSNAWKTTDVDFNVQAHYCDIEYNNIIYQGRMVDYSHFGDAYIASKIDPLYGASKSKRSVIPSNWINIFTVFQSKLDTITANNITKVANTLAFRSMYKYSVLDAVYKYINENVKNTRYNTLYQEMMEDIDMSNITQYEEAQKYCKALGISLVDTFSPTFEKIMEIYPLLNHNHPSLVKDEFVKYIQGAG